jgi:protein-disulfide isomerase
MNTQSQTVRRRSQILHTTVAVLGLTTIIGCAGPAAPSHQASQQSIDHLIERYIQSHPEVIEQSLQALESKREAEEKTRQKAALATKQHELLNDPNSPVSGNLTGSVTLVEFFDYRCGFCKRAAGAVTQLQQEDPRVRVIYKDLPILGEASELAAKAALASKIQGKHQAFHEALLATKGDTTKESILAVASEVGLDAKKLDADMQSPDLQILIDRNRALAKDLGISGTPGFIVGTEMVPGALDLKGLKDLIARAGMPAPTGGVNVR